MKKSKLSIFDKTISLDEAFNGIEDEAGKQSIVREIAIRHILQQNFSQIDLNQINSKENEGSLLETFYKNAKLEKEEDISKFHEKTKIAKDLLLDQLKYQDKVNKLREKTVNQESINDTFLKMKPQLDKVLFRIIRLENEDTAKEIHLKIRDDKEDFAELAKKYSVGPEAKNGGIVQPRALSALNPELRSKLSSLKEGEITEPFALTENLFVIIQLVKLERAKLNKQTENQIKTRLFNQWLNNQIDLAKIKLVS
ncbi:MAG: peptidylprolyl isomerase [Candidatus Caenarcaniphilales bacterium]|nr:peptidylprolyl isomerase [Candidatus Caenarcaniphilales bacterium]